MKIPPDAIITEEKLTQYLLKQRTRNDKSKLLLQLGFSIDAAAILEAAIRNHAAGGEAVLEEQDIYGKHFVLHGNLVGPLGTLQITSVWVQRAGEKALRFVTLKPAGKT